MDRDVLMPLLLEAVSRDNILPLTSACNARCVFCSHHQNPRGTCAYIFSHLPEDLLDELLSYLDRERKIVIGESSSRLCEGEPLTHPFFFDLLEKVRELYPRTPVQVTTNAMLLDDQALTRLEQVQGEIALGGSPLLELVISLNCVSVRQRWEIMGDPDPGKTLGNVQALRKKGFLFHGSIVALPHLTGWNELGETLQFLDCAGARTTRVFLPGFTCMSKKDLQFSARLWGQLHEFLENQAEKVRHPVTMEPPLKNELEARVEGVIQGSSAWQVGIRRKDLLQRVNGQRVYSAAEAFCRIQEAASPQVELQRRRLNERITSFSFIMEKEPGEPSGLVLARDLEPHDLEAVAGELERSKAQNPLLLTSKLAEVLWISAREQGLAPERLTVHGVGSHFFGGNIACAGLLTVSDFSRDLEALCRSERWPYDLVMLPQKPFDRKGHDLQGRHYRDLITSFPHVIFSFL